MDIRDCLQKLTLEEKISLLEGSDMGFTTPISRLEIPRILLVDGPHGIRVVQGTDGESGEPYTMNGQMEAATALPCESAMASTWNIKLLERAGKQIGEECQKFGVSVLLGPGADGKRSPLGGRNFEYYSEDPFVSGKMAAAFIKGIQSEGVGACMKHYVLNEQETRRMSVDVHVDERALWEIYLKPFEIAINESKPWCIMGSYNKVGGFYVCENKELLIDILRDKLRFDGVVVSDWSAVKNKVVSVKNGLNLQMPGPSGKVQEVLAAIESGELNETELDDRVVRILELIDKVTSHKKMGEIDWEEHHETAARLAEEGMVLLKNEDAALPLKKNSSVAVVGELAKNPPFAGGGSSVLTPRQLDIPLEEIGKYANVTYAEGYHGSETSEELLEEACRAAEKAEAVIVCLGSISSEGLDREHLLLPKSQTQVLHRIAKVNSKVILVTMCGSAVEYRNIEPEVKAILHAWLPGEGCGSAIANILFGETCPSGKLAETFPVSLPNTPAYQDFPGFKDDVYYREGLLTGYRYYDTKEILPFYHFGYGLSYTTFTYSNMRLSSNRLRNGEQLKVSVDVANTGCCSGKEVVQIYVSDLESHMFRPKKELKGFEKVDLLPGETKTVTVVLEEDAFAYYLPHMGRFVVESGEFEILVGASVMDIKASDKVIFKSKDDVRVPLTMDDLFKDYLTDDRYSENAKKVFEMLQIDETNPFYHLLYGSSLYQTTGLLGFLGMDDSKGNYIVDCLVNRKEIVL